MIDLRAAAEKALAALEDASGRLSLEFTGHLVYRDEISDLRTALAQPEQEDVAWLTKDLMADYLDMIAEAINTNNSEFIQHKAHWMRHKGDL